MTTDGWPNDGYHESFVSSRIKNMGGILIKNWFVSIAHLCYRNNGRKLLDIDIFQGEINNNILHIVYQIKVYRCIDMSLWWLSH